MSEDSRKEWEYFQNKVIPAFIDRLTDLEEQKTDIDVKKKDIIQEMAEQAEQFMQSEEISRFLKAKLKGIVAERTISEALGEQQKRRYQRYQEMEKSGPLISNEENTKTIEVSSSGSQSVTGADGNEREQETEIKEQMAEIAAEHVYRHPSNDIATNRIAESDEESEIHNTIAEHSAEIALNTIDTLKKEIEDKDIRLNEAFHLIEDKESVIEKLRVQLGNLEIEVGELKRKPTIPTTKDVDSREDLQIQLDEAQQTIAELRQVEAIHTRNQDFNLASKVASPPKVWVAAINASGLTRALIHIAMKTADKGKILFDVTDEGQLKNPRPEGV